MIRRTRRKKVEPESLSLKQHCTPHFVTFPNRGHIGAGLAGQCCHFGVSSEYFGNKTANTATLGMIHHMVLQSGAQSAAL
jgi:hypothetical protein